MHNEVGITANGRREVGIALQRQPEVADVLGVVLGLALGAQHHGAHQFAVGCVGCSLQDAVQHGGGHGLGLTQIDVQRLKKLTQGLELFRRGWRVNTEYERAFSLFQRFGGCDVGLDHEFLDQAVRLKALAYADRLYATVFAKFDATLGKVEIEWASPVASLAHGAIAGEQWLQRDILQRFRFFVRPLIESILGLSIGEACGRPHERALEAMGLHASVGAEGEVAGNDGPVLAFLE